MKVTTRTNKESPVQTNQRSLAEGENAHKGSVPLCLCSEDSILLCTIDGIPLYYSHEQILNYLKRAHLLYYIDSHLVVIEKADTFYLPKMNYGVGSEVNPESWTN